MATSMKSEKPEVKIVCRGCEQERSLSGGFRLFRANPLAYMDFCHTCEKQRGTIALYRRYPSNCTTEIRDAIYKAQRTPEGRRTEEQVRLLVVAAPKLDPKTAAEAAQGELYKRELQRRSLIYYVSSFFPEYKAGWVHQDTCRRLEKFMAAVERGESPRLMIFMPPRTGKSKLASDMFISWI